MKSKTSFFNRTVFKKNMTLYWPIWVCYLLYGMVKVPGQLWSRLQQQTDMTAYARDYALYNSLRLEVVPTASSATCTAFPSAGRSWATA